MQEQGFLIAGTKFIIIRVVSYYCLNYIPKKSLLVHQALGFSTLPALRLVNLMNPHSFFVRISIIETTSKEILTSSSFYNELFQWCLHTHTTIFRIRKLLAVPPSKILKRRDKNLYHKYGRKLIRKFLTRA
jgi:hypothetical protein